MPGPWSRTTQLAARQGHVDASSRRGPLAGVLEQVPDGPFEPLRGPSTVVGSMSRVEVTFGNRDRARSTAFSTSSSSWTVRARAAGVAAGELEQRRRSGRASRALRARGRRRAARAAPESRRPCCFSTSMFVCMLVSGVRSSCDASATKRRCVSIDSSSAASIVLNELPSRESSSWPPSRRRARSGRPSRRSAPPRRSAGAPGRAPHARRARRRLRPRRSRRPRRGAGSAAAGAGRARCCRRAHERRATPRARPPARRRRV